MDSTSPKENDIKTGTKASVSAGAIMGGIIAAFLFVVLVIAGDAVLSILGATHNPGEDYPGRVQNLTTIFIASFVLLFLVSNCAVLSTSKGQSVESRLLSTTTQTYLSFLALTSANIFLLPVMALPAPLCFDITVQSAARSAFFLAAFPICSGILFVTAIIFGFITLKIRKLKSWQKSERNWLAAIIVIHMVALAIIGFLCFRPAHP